jgi:hypothetical protein
MDYICSLTGKSPSTTGFGSEGALTKAPFNALLPVVDINSAVVSAILTGAAGFTTAAGYIGPNFRVDHDNSMLVPELWCRMRVHERDPKFLIEKGYLERVEDFTFEGRIVRASRLGFRITALFVDHFLGRIFELPSAVFPEEMLRPEKQNLTVFAAGVDAIVSTQRKVALNYFEDGSIADACPPVRALLHIMAFGEYEGMTAGDDQLRALFSYESLLQSDWYKARLHARQSVERNLWQRRIQSLASYLDSSPTPPDLRLGERLETARKRLQTVSEPQYWRTLVGTIGADPSILPKQVKPESFRSAGAEEDHPEKIATG